MYAEIINILGKIFYLGQNGFTLSAILNDCNQEWLDWNTRLTSVHLICQKGEKSQSIQPEYLVKNLSIIVQGETADVPELMTVISSHCIQASKNKCFSFYFSLEILFFHSFSNGKLMQFSGIFVFKGYKVADIFNRPDIYNNKTGWFQSTKSYESQCQIIFEKTSSNYYMTVHDVMLYIKKSRKHDRYRFIDHDSYISCIQAYCNQGWQLAGMIHMDNRVDLNRSSEYTESFWSTIKLIFQAPAGEGNPGGVL